VHTDMFVIFATKSTHTTLSTLSIVAFFPKIKALKQDIKDTFVFRLVTSIIIINRLNHKAFVVLEEIS
jgi:hypothetical protein